HPWAATAAFGLTAAAITGGYLGLITAAVPIDLGIGRRHIRLGPHSVDIHADRDTVFNVLAEPYLARQTRAIAEKIHIIARGSDMVLAAHRTPVHGGRLIATTVETVRFTRPDRVEFHLVRGPVPEVSEQFLLTEHPAPALGGEPVTRLEYHGQLGTDLWAPGAAWGRLIARHWQQVVADTFVAVTTEAERRAAAEAPEVLRRVVPGSGPHRDLP
ncbi:MAG: hypothetical protein ACRDQX_14845, partial [Pseudonocardiaceae bacterium]